MKIFFLLILTTLTACSTNPIRQSDFQVSDSKISKEITDLELKFDQEKVKRNIKATESSFYPIVLEKSKIEARNENGGHMVVNIFRTGFIAECDPKNHYIAVLVDEWNKLTSVEKEVVIFHELGHCVLKEAHDDKYGCNRDKTIMCSNVRDMKSKEYAKDPNPFLDDLFNTEKYRSYEYDYTKDFGFMVSVFKMEEYYFFNRPDAQIELLERMFPEMSSDSVSTSVAKRRLYERFYGHSNTDLHFP